MSTSSPASATSASASPGTPSAALASPAEALLVAVRNGRPLDALEVLEPLPLAQRRRAWTPALREAADGIDLSPDSARDPQGRWVGRLRQAHWDAATVARLGTREAQIAAKRVHPVELPVARDLIPRLFPEQLDVFVEVWSQAFLSNPKAWDRLRGVEAMFDWAQQGLVPPPTQRGAVLLLIALHDLSEYLDEHPVLIGTTLPLLFQVEGRKGASAAQRDHETRPALSLGRHLVPRLIREGHWEREQVLQWCEQALAMPRSAYELRWFRALRERVEALR